MGIGGDDMILPKLSLAKLIPITVAEFEKRK
jgi:hypothetical protein